MPDVDWVFVMYPRVTPNAQTVEHQTQTGCLSTWECSCVYSAAVRIGFRSFFSFFGEGEGGVLLKRCSAGFSDVIFRFRFVVVVVFPV